MIWRCTDQHCGGVWENCISLVGQRSIVCCNAMVIINVQYQTLYLEIILLHWSIVKTSVEFGLHGESHQTSMDDSNRSFLVDCN